MLAVAALLALCDSASAAFPGANGRIAFSQFDSGDREIYTANPDGSGVLQLTDNSSFDNLPSWSPDGSKIVFVGNRDGATPEDG